MPTYAIVCNDITTNLDELMDDYSTRFLIIETAITVIRLLHKRGFRNVTIYHSSQTPFNPGNYSTKMYTSNAECIASMLTDADVVIEMKTEHT